MAFRRPAARREVYLFSALDSLVIGAVVALVSLPLLAVVPLSGDSAELVALAQHGGVPHPPGFPLQAWLGRLFIHLPLANPVTRLALLSLLAHAAAAVCIAELLRGLGARFAARLGGALLFAWFPTVWSLGTHPEVFALAYLLIAALYWQALALLARPPDTVRVRDALALGALVGLAAAQHPITVVAAPAFLAALARVATERTGRWRRIAASALAFATVAVGLYLSLPALRTGSVWPDWGDLAVGPALWRHVTRAEYGTLSLSAGAGAESMRALSALAYELWGTPALLPALALAGLVALGRARRYPVQAVLGAGLATALGFLWLARMEGPDPVAIAYLERFQGVVVVPLAIAAGLGIDALAASTRRPAALGLALALVSATALLATGHERADASQRNELDLLQRAFAAQLPAGALYLANTDDQVFGGVPRGDRTRYPVSVSLLRQPWYRERVAPALDPRLPWAQLTSLRQVLEAAAARGLVVASTEREQLEAGGQPVELVGLLWQTAAPGRAELNARTAQAAVALCPFVAELVPLPPGAPSFGSTAWTLFARAFDAAAAYLEEPQPAAAAEAAAVARALEDGTDPASWTSACGRLAEQLEHH